MDDLTIYGKLKGFIDVLDYENGLSTLDYLMELIDDVEDCGEIAFDKYEVAKMLSQCDIEYRFHPDVKRFVIDILKEEVEKGNCEAMCDLGMMYYHGYRGIRQSFKKAIEYNTMAADKGSKQALENLGYCYYYGRGGQPDYEKAYVYFIKGSQDGNLVSLYKLGDMYLNGYYVEKNPEEAYKIYEKCIGTMDNDNKGRVAGPVYLRLAKMKLYGQAGYKDPDIALLMYQKAEGFLSSMINNSKGFLFVKSYREAVEGQKDARTQIEEDMYVFDWFKKIYKIEPQ